MYQPADGFTLFSMLCQFKMQTFKYCSYSLKFFAGKREKN